MSSLTPSTAELRSVCQPPDVLGRVNAEHWAGRLYMRKVSVHATRVALRLGLSADAVTWLMIASGLAAGLVLTLPGLLAAVGALLLIQAQLLLDCSDGEVARWRRTSSPVGVYLDRIGHYSTEAGLAAALGVRAAGGWRSLDGWTTWGLVAAVLVLMVKSETDLVHVARAHASLPLLEDKGRDKLAPRGRRSSALRRALRFVPFYRALIAVELSALAVGAAVADAAFGDLAGTRVLVGVLVPLALVVVAGHLYSILRSGRLR